MADEVVTAHIPIIPVYLRLNPQTRGKGVDIKLSTHSPITGSDLKEKVHKACGIPTNRQIVVALNSSLEAIVHEEKPVCATDMANVCVLECRLEPINVYIQLTNLEKAASPIETVPLTMNPDDKVVWIKEKIESMKKIDIQRYIIFFNNNIIQDQDVALSHYHIGDNSTITLVYSGTLGVLL